MKTLVLSFLRLGDFFQHVHLLRSLSQNREQEITILGFSELKPAISLFPEYSFELISRPDLLGDLTRRDFPWYRAGFKLENHLRRLQDSIWGTVINLSHTTFSARIMDCIPAQEKWGVQFANGHSTGWNPWLTEMNNNWVDNQAPQFTYVELLSKAMGMALSAPLQSVRQGSEIWLQPLTSDSKKNWALDNWKILVKQLSKSHRVRVIGAPGEATILRPWFPSVEVLTFEQIRTQKTQCRLLVSGDTSVIHFAALEQIPTVGIYLGAANPLKTPPRQTGAKIVVGETACWPCAHRSPCSQATHLCGEAVTAKQVLKIIESELKGKDPEGGIYGQRRRRASFEYTQEA